MRRSTLRRQLATNAAAVAAAVVGVAGLASGAQAQAVCGTNVISNLTPPYNGGASPGETDGLVATINTDTIWGGAANPSPICLHEPAFVTAGATLTILPGTIIYGEPRTGPAAPPAVNGSPGTLVITQDARIDSEGSPTNPVIFTTGAMDNNDDGVCDDLDANGFLDEYPGFDPATCPVPGPCVAAPAPKFCDDAPATNPRGPLAPNGSANVTQWGGVILLGRAPNNLANGSGLGYGIGQVEGLPLPGVPIADATCGGVEPHDDSGVVRYTSVRHGGDEISASNEINGFTLCGVGDTTIFEFNEVYSNFDDGVEVFGGTVNLNHLAIEYVGDDYLDLDWGYTGFVQFVFAVNTFFQRVGGGFGQAGGDRFGEWDGNDFGLRAGDVNVRIDTNSVGGPDDQTPWPEGHAWVYNYTGIGSTPDVNPVVAPILPAAANEGIFMRHGFAGAILNSLFVNTGSEPCVEAADGPESSTLGHQTCTNHAGQDLIRMVSTSCDDGAALAGCQATAAANGNAYALLETGLACSQNEVNTAAFTGLQQEDPTFDPRGVNGIAAPNPTLGRLVPGGAPYDPRPNAALVGPAGIACGVMPTRSILDRSATYRGAFTQTAPELWTDGWTVLNIAGLLAN